jgi:hypothetical protein
MNDSEDQSFVTRLLANPSPSAVERYGRFATHLFASTGKTPLLSVIRQCLEQSQGMQAQRLRQTVFEQSAIKKSVLPGSAVPVEVVDPLVDTLRTTEDGVSAASYVYDLVEILKGDKKGKNYDTVSRLISIQLIRRFCPSSIRGPDSSARPRRKK